MCRVIEPFHLLLQFTAIYNRLARQCSLFVLEYVTNPFLVLLCGFAQYETERLQYVDLAYSDVANAIHKEYIYKVISSHALICNTSFYYSLKLHAFVKKTHSKLYRIDIGN
jgi:hypothetical protein